jgi:hypothetical protein
MPNDEPAPAQITVHEWLDRVRASLEIDGDLTLTSSERRLLLEMARIAAHASERVAAPLSTYLAGIALAGLSPAMRAERLEAIVRNLEATIG